MPVQIESFRISGHDIRVPLRIWRLLNLCDRLPGGIPAVADEVDRLAALRADDPSVTWSRVPVAAFPLVQRVRRSDSNMTERTLTATIAQWRIWSERIAANLPPEPPEAEKLPPSEREKIAAKRREPDDSSPPNPEQLRQFVRRYDPAALRRELAVYREQDFIGRRMGRVLSEVPRCKVDDLASCVVAMERELETVDGRTE